MSAVGPKRRDIDPREALDPDEVPDDLDLRTTSPEVPAFRTALEIYRDLPGRIADLEDTCVRLERWNRSLQAQVIELFLVRDKNRS